MNFQVVVKSVREEWLSNPKNDLLSGLVVALALIPESIGFSIIAGVDPKVGLYASFCIAVVCAFAGGRSGMISAATGAMALVFADLVRDYGVQYLFAVTVLTGILQILAGYLGLSALMKFVSRSVVTGFVNALGILYFITQAKQFYGVGWQMYAMVAAGLVVIYGLPRVTKAVPSALVCIVLLTVVSVWQGMDLRTIGDMGRLPKGLPVFQMFDVPWRWETLRILFPYAVALCAVGLLESLMTATIIDDFTDTPSDKNRECRGQGMANVVAGLFGGMAGCALIGQSVMNMKGGGRTRLSTLSAGVFLLFVILVLGDWVSRIPMAALVAVMLMVAVSTVKWGSLRELLWHPKSSSVVMVATTIVVVWTHNLAIGVLVGVLLNVLFFARKVEKLFKVEDELSEDGKQRTYCVFGQLFFASVEGFEASFDFKEEVERVRVDVSAAHFWDLCSVEVLDRVVMKFRARGIVVEVVGLNRASAMMVEKLAVYDKSDGVELRDKH